MASELNEIRGTTTVEQKTFGFTLTSRFRAALNVEFGTSLILSNTKTSQLSLKTQTQTLLTVAKLEAARSKFKGNITAKHELIEDKEFSREYYDFDITIDYRILKKLGIRLSGINVLHLKQKEWYSISNTTWSVSRNLYRQMPGNLLLGISYLI
jgi:hypothetical protein